MPTKSDELKKYFQLDEFYLDLQKDSSQIILMSDEDMNAYPYPGLRPFRTSEYQLFFGREGQADLLVQKLEESHFLGVIGSSGTGKSSLVRAGLLPQLYSGYLFNAGTNWKVAISRPGNNPIKNLAVSLTSVLKNSTDNEVIEENLDTVEGFISENPFGLIEYYRQLIEEQELDSGTNLLVIIDQFEELFRYKRESGEIESSLSAHFVNLLLKACSNLESNVYVIITMRSEYLGDCVQFRGLPDAINKGQYLVPRLQRSELKEAIMEPLRLIKKEISPIMVNRLIDEVGDNMDQLPILQHALMRTYEHWKNHHSSSELDYEQYESIGKMEKALATHANEKFSELGTQDLNDQLSKKQKVAKIVFQSITDRASDDRGIRRPTRLNSIYSVANEIGANAEEVNEVIDHFRDKNTSFLMPPDNVKLYPELVIDIAHESLMRNWELLEVWISEEVEAAKLYKSLNERRELFESGRSGYVRGGLLEDMIKWMKEYPVNSIWASRYHSKTDGISDDELFEKNIAFLKKSEIENERIAKEELERETETIIRQQKEKANRIRIRIISIGLILLFFLSIGAGVGWVKAEEERKEALWSKDEAAKQTEIANGALEEAEREKLATIEANELLEIEKRNLKDTVYTLTIVRRDLTKTLGELRKEERRREFLSGLAGTSWFNQLSDLQREFAEDTLFTLSESGDIEQLNRMTKSLEFAGDALLASKATSPKISTILYLIKEAKSTDSNIISDEVYVTLKDEYSYYESKVKTEGPILDLEFVENDSKLIFGTRDGFFTYDISTSRIDTIEKWRQSWEQSLDISDDGRFLLSINSSDNLVNIRDSSGELIRSIPTGSSQQGSYISDFKGKFSPGSDKVLVHAPGDTVLSMYNIQGELETEFKGDNSDLIDFHLSNNYVAISYRNRLDLWNYEGVLLDTTLEGRFVSVALSDNEEKLLSQEFGRELELINISSGEVQQTFPHNELVRMAKFPPEGQHFITSEHDWGSNNTINVWSQDGNKINQFLWHKSRVLEIEYSSDGSRVASVSRDGEIFVWGIEKKNVKGTEIDAFIDLEAVVSYFSDKASTNKSNNDNESAEENYLKALSVNPENRVVWNLLGIFYYENLDDYKKAANSFLKAIEIDSTQKVYWSNLGMAYYQDSKYDSSIVSHKKALRYDSSYARSLNGIGDAYYGDGDYIKAINYYRQSVQNDSENHFYWNDLGDSFRMNDELDSAIVSYKKALSFAPDYAYSLNELGDVYHIKGNYPEAIKFYRQAIHYSPENQYFWNDLGDSFRMTGEYDSAAVNYEKALTLDPDNSGFLNELGLTYNNKGEYETATSYLLRAIEIDSTVSSYWNNLASSEFSLKKYDVALEKNLKSIRLDSTNSTNWNNTALSYNHLGDYNKAYEYASRSLNLSPESNTSYAHRGFALFKLAREGALEDLEKSLELNQEYEKIYFYLASFYASKGDKERALKNLELALQKGFHWMDWIEKEESLDSIRTDSEFTDMLNKYLK